MRGITSSGVAPGQLSPRCGGNLAVGERGRELDHVPQRPLVEAAPVALCKLSRRRGDNLPAVLRAAAFEHARVKVVADLPMECGKRRIRDRRDCFWAASIISERSRTSSDAKATSGFAVPRSQPTRWSSSIVCAAPEAASRRRQVY
jgi:hypothetical protein